MLKTNKEELEMDLENSENITQIKKNRKFHAKEFRENLKSNNSLATIKEFVLLCTEGNSTQDCALEYLENGGTLSELCHFIDTFDKKNARDAAPAFEAFNIVLLKLLSKRRAESASCEETCREFLVKYYPFIKSMLSLNASSKQRRVALRVLSSVVSVSGRLAKDVLAYATFDRAMLDVLTGVTGPDNSVRTAFIHFLLAFLVQDNTQLVAAFLDKKGLLASLFPGLMYDKRDTIQLVLSTIKDRVLEDKRLSKTIKMNTFNTQVVKSLIELYEWRGPLSRKTGNMKKRLRVTEKPDEQEKQKVMLCIHEFLLVLLASKSGVIFRDVSCGVGGGRTHNPLLLTVIRGLRTPWEQQLSAQLLVRICQTCPDLLVPVIEETRSALLPVRATPSWLKASHFVRDLLESSVPPSQLLVALTPRQLTQWGQTACAPEVALAALKELGHESTEVQEELVQLLLGVCQAVERLLATVPTSSPLNDSMRRYLTSRLPSPAVLATLAAPVKQVSDLTTIPAGKSQLPAVLHALRLYRTICPDLLQDVTQHFPILEHLQSITTHGDDTQIKHQMLVDSVDLFLYCDFASFLPTTQIFDYCVPLLFNIYVASRGTQSNIEDTLLEVMKNSGAFDGCQYEVNIWLHSLLECLYDEDIGSFITAALKLTYTNYVTYCKEISERQENISEECVFNYKQVIESLALDVSCENPGTICHRSLGPLALGALQALTDKPQGKSYLNIALVHLLHAQTSLQILTSIVLATSHIDKNLIKYFHKWNDCQTLISLKKIYQNKNSVTRLCKYLVEDGTDIENVFETIESHQIVLCVRLIIFYLTQLARTKHLTENAQNKCLIATEILLNKSQDADILNLILKNPLLIQLFSPNNKGDQINILCTNFILKVIEILTKDKSMTELEPYLYSYRTILIRQIYVMLEKCKKHNKPPKSSKIMEVVEALAMNAEHCYEVMRLCGIAPTGCLVTPENTPSTVTHLISYALRRCLQVRSSTPFDMATMTLVANHLVFLNEYKVDIILGDLETNLYDYVERYPHTLVAFNENVFKSILLKPTISRTSCRLAGLLLTCNHKLFNTVLEVVHQISDKRELIFSLLFALLGRQTAQVDQFFEDMYTKHAHIILKVINKPQKAAQYLVEYYKVIIKMVETVLPGEVCQEFCSKIQKFDSSETYHYEMVVKVFDRCIKGSTESKYIYNLIVSTMNYILSNLKRAERSDEDKLKITNIVNIFMNCLNKWKVEYKRDNVDGSVLQNSTFETWSKMCLKCGVYGEASLLRALRGVLDSTGDLVNTSDWGGEVLYGMTLGHSSTVEVLLGPNCDVKQELVLLLCTLGGGKDETERELWLRAYGASISVTDRALLRLIARGEPPGNGVLLWGEAASGANKGAGTLWRRPTPGAALDLLDLERVRETITHFPIWRSIDATVIDNGPKQNATSGPKADLSTNQKAEDGLETKTYNSNQTNDIDSKVYDPVFYLPLICSALDGGGEPVAWYRCKAAAVPLCVIALGSERSCTRRAALLALARFREVASGVGARGKDRLLYVHAVEAACRAAASNGGRLPPLAAVFLSRAVLIFSRPDHALYPALTAYILARPRPDVTRVPELLELLHSANVQHAQHRNFLLEVIRDGLRTKIDLGLVDRSVGWKLLGGLWSAGKLLDFEGRRLILSTFNAGTKISSRSHCHDHGLLVWLYAQINVIQLTAQLLIPTIHLLHSTYIHLEAEYRIHNHFNMLLCLAQLLNPLQQYTLPLEDFVLYLSTLSATYMAHPVLLNREMLTTLLHISSKYMDCQICNYYLQFGTDFAQAPALPEDNLTDKGLYYLRLLTLHWIQVNQ